MDPATALGLLQVGLDIAKFTREAFEASEHRQENAHTEREELKELISTV